MESAMLAGKFLVIFILLLNGAESWHRRRRRQQCTPQDCQVSSWYSWNSCSVSTCGRHGSQSRSRSITTHPACGGNSCPLNLRESRLCHGSRAENCQVSSWSNWNSCSASTCGRRGSQSRSRSITSHELCGGDSCPELYESRHCYRSSSENCQLSSWSQWSACTATRCGSSAIQTSTRHRITTEKCGGGCTTIFRKTRMCYRAPDDCSQGLYEWFRLTFSNSLIIHKVNYKSLHVYHITCMCLDTQ